MTAAPGPCDRPQTTACAGSSRFRHAVDRDLVHRRSIAEVYITDCARDGDRFVVCAQWPRSHTVYCQDGRYHPTLLMETMRQAVLATCHGVLDVPPDSRFVMSRIFASGLDRLPPIGPVPADVRLHLTRTPGPSRSRSGWDIQIQLTPDTTVTGGGDITVLSPPQYARLRGEHADRVRNPAPNRPIGPGRVGRLDPADVCLGDGPDGRLQLHLDQRHPVYYDHPLDHVPGALLLECAIQRAHAHRPDFQVSDIDTYFDSFIEPDEPCTVTCTSASKDSSAHLLVEFHQGTAVRTTVMLTAPRPGRGGA